MWNGIIVIRKEPGFTSHDVVAKMRGICGQKKIGHTGTLDPAATGVLPVCLGNATKLCDMLADKDKEYVAELLLGMETDTQDTTGTVVVEHEVKVTGQEVQEAVMSFLGEYDQTPPMYSALKVNGKKLYELARAGKEVERKPRKVFIHEIEILEMALPSVRFRVVCSKGTYIRTLCADIGEKLSCGGTMKRLERTRVGTFELKDAVTLEELQSLKDSGELEKVILPVDYVFKKFSELHILEKWNRLIDNGNSFYPQQTRENYIFPKDEWVRIYREDNTFVGIYSFDTVKKCYKPVKMFL